MREIGHRIWAVAAGHIPPDGTGREPEWTSYDKICLLNAGDQDAHVVLTIFYSNKEPMRGYPLIVGGRRVRHIRLNDLIDPEAIPLDEDYGCLIESDVPILVQFVHQDTRKAENALFCTLAFPIE